MAKVFKLPAGLEPPQFDFATQSYAVYEQAEREYFERLTKTLKEAEPTDELAGTVLRFPFADGYAVYVVVRSRKGLTLYHVPIGDAWRVPAAHERGLRVVDARTMVQREAALEAIFARHAAQG